MYCVIQEIQRKKPDKYGAYKTLEVYTTVVLGKVRYDYRYSGKRFQRPIKTAYKISLHSSSRVNGVVTKKQNVVTTVGYYDLVQGYLYIDDMIADLAIELDTDEGTLYTLIDNKVKPLRDKIIQEFQRTEEYKTSVEHYEIIRLHKEKKKQFAAQHGVDADEYDCCYNVFGELVNPEYLKEIRQRKQKEYEERHRAHEQYRRYQKEYNYNGVSFSSNYTEDERTHLREFYRLLSRTYHPDNNRDTDTTEKMKLVNKMKDVWQV